MIHDPIGGVHTLAAVVALITGSMVLWRNKGTITHKKIGRVYGISMIIVCLTSFFIYRVHNRFGILHFFALLSTLTLILGMFPLYQKRMKHRIVQHLSWMYWSVIGLYSAFVAEILTRLPQLFEVKSGYGLFYGLVFLSAGLVGWLGSYFFKKKLKGWKEQFAS